LLKITIVNITKKINVLNVKIYTLELQLKIAFWR